MPLLIDTPLFATTASGSIKGVGTFKTNSRGTYLVVSSPGNTTSVPATATLRACFATAKQSHGAIFPSSVFVGGRWRMLRLPAWPDYWTQWLIANPACLL